MEVVAFFPFFPREGIWGILFKNGGINFYLIMKNEYP